MAGKSSNLGAPSSSAISKTLKKQEEKRKLCATRAEKAKKRRPLQLTTFTAHPCGSGTAVPAVVPPVHRGASNNMATAALPFPMAGVNGAAPLWSTAAAMGAASRAAALTLTSQPATVSANNGPAAATPVVITPAPAPGLQQPPASAAATASNVAASALALAAASSAGTDVTPPLVLAQTVAGGQLVSLPLQFVGYQYHPTPTCRASSRLLPPAPPAVGIPLAKALNKIENGVLGRMLTALMPVCSPPLRQHQSKTTGPLPPWWPMGSEDWWGHELLQHLDSVAAVMRAPPVPFGSSYCLKKAQKVAVLVAIVKHLAPDFARVAEAVRHSAKLSASEIKLWHSALDNERARYSRPVFVLLPPQQKQQQPLGGGGASTDPSAAGSVVVHSELQVANLPAAASSVSVSAPADGGSCGEVIAAAAELVVDKEQSSDGDGVGVGVGVSATDAPPAGDDGRDPPVDNFPAGDGDDGSTHKQGAAVAAATPTTGHAGQVAGGLPEMTTMQPEQVGGVAGDDVAVAAAAAAAEDDQAHPVVVAPNPNADAVAAIEEEAPPEPEDHQWWCNNGELINRMFAEFESFGDVWY